MQIFDFITKCDVSNKAEVERAKYLCYYQYKECGESQFSLASISELMLTAGYNTPNTSRLKDALTKGKKNAFLISKGNKCMLSFIPAVLQEIESTI